MNWAILIPVIAQYGLPFAERLWLTWTQNKGEPTQAEWDALKDLASQTAESQLLAALQRAGIPMDSTKALELLALVRPQ